MKRFKNIFCVVSPEESARPTLDRAASLAENNQARLTVVDVVPSFVMPKRVAPGLPSRAELEAATVRDRLQALQGFTAPYLERIPIQCEVLIGTAFLEIIRTILRNGHDLLIKLAEHPAFLSRPFGSGDMHLLRKCPCPVWLTRPGERSNYARILVAVDFDPDQPEAPENTLAQDIVTLACSLALSDFAELHVLHVWDAPGEMMVRTWSDHPDAAVMGYVEAVRAQHQRSLDMVRARIRNAIGETSYDYLSPQFHLRRGTPAELIPEVAKALAVDLVVMGTAARSGIPGLLIGNTAESVLTQLECAVLAVKPPGFVSPVSL